MSGTTRSSTAFHARLSRKDVTPTCLWKTPAINRILTNEQYAGTYIAGKLYSKEVGSRVRLPKDKSEWIVIPNMESEINAEEHHAKKLLRREVRQFALTRMEDAARTQGEFENIVAEWDKLDENRERKERYWEKCPLEKLTQQEEGRDTVVPPSLDHIWWRQMMKGNSWMLSSTVRMMYRS